MTANIDDIQKKLVSDQDELTRKIADKIGELVEEATEELEEVSDNAKEAFDNFEKCVADLKPILTDCEKIINSIDTMSLKAEKLSQTSDKLVAVDIKIESTVQQSLGKLTEGTEKIDDSIDSAVKNINEYGVKIRESADKCSAEIIESTGRFSDIQVELAALSDKIAQIQESIGRQIESFSLIISGGVDNVDRLSKACNTTAEGTEKLVQELHMCKDQLGNLLTEFAKRTERLSDGLNECERDLKEKCEEIDRELDESFEKYGSKFSGTIQRFEEAGKDMLMAFEKKSNDIVSQSQLAREEVLRLEEQLKANAEIFEDHEQQSKKQIYIALGMMAVIAILNIINLFI